MVLTRSLDIPLLNARNPYRNTAFVTRRNQTGKKKKQRGANPFGRNPMLGLNGRMVRQVLKKNRTRRRRRKQQTGANTIYPLWGPGMKFLKKSRRQRKQQKGENPLFGPAVKLGVKLGRSKKYRRMSLSGFSDTGGKRYHRPWQV